MVNAKKTVRKTTTPTTTGKKTTARKAIAQKPRVAKNVEPLTHEQSYKALKSCLNQLRRSASDEQKIVISQAQKHLKNLYNDTCTHRSVLDNIEVLLMQKTPFIMA